MRQFNPEVGLVGADRVPVAPRIDFCGSLKWPGTVVGAYVLRRLRHDVRQVPGFDAGRTGLVVVSRSGAELPDGSVEVVRGPDDVVAAWHY